MADYVMRQTPDGVWHAESNDGDRIEHIAGWERVADLMSHHDVRWTSADAFRRFRSQFGRPPPGLVRDPTVGG